MNGPDLKTLTSYFRLMNTNGAAQAYHAALDAGVLSALETGPQSSRQIAENCGLQEHPTSLLLEALRAMGIVELSDSSYQLAEVTRMLLYSDYRELGNHRCERNAPANGGRECKAIWQDSSVLNGRRPDRRHRRLSRSLGGQRSVV
jgi:hypothetical protein